jgi:hypothetical protein
MNEPTFEAFYDAPEMQRSVDALIALTERDSDSEFAERACDLLREIAHAAYLHSWSDAVTTAMR